MKNGTQSGFAVIETILILVLVAILGFTGWFVWHAKQNAEKTLDATSKSSAEQKVVPVTAAPSAKWLQISSKNGAFTASIPDGWSGVNYGGADQMRFTSISYKAGAKVSLTDADSPYAGDSEVPLSVELFHAGGPFTALIPEAKISDHDLGSYDGTKFYKKYDASTEPGVGARNKGDADYAYRIDIASDEVLYVYYHVKAGQTDQVDLVEQFIAAIHVN